MNEGRESLLGANVTQESPLGPNKGESSPTAADTTLDVIARICTKYDQDVGRKAQHCMAEIASVIRKASTTEAKGGAA